MQMIHDTHPIDRLMRRARGLIYLIAAAAFPVAVVGYGLMLKLAAENWPAWAFAAVCASHLIGLLGLASLIDSRQEQQIHQSN